MGGEKSVALASLSELRGETTHDQMTEGARHCIMSINAHPHDRSVSFAFLFLQSLGEMVWEVEMDSLFILFTRALNSWPG